MLGAFTCLGSAFMALLVILLAIVASIFVLYNSLIMKRNAADRTFSTVDVLLKRRYDLIPNLVETVKGYYAHEKETFETIARLRAQATDPNASVEQKIALDAQMQAPLRTLIASFERYPHLKANENALHLQRSLVDVEEQISAGRRAFNAAVLEYNNAVQMVPTSIIASAFSMKTKPFFSISSQEAQPVGVDFNRA